MNSRFPYGWVLFASWCLVTIAPESATTQDSESVSNPSPPVPLLKILHLQNGDAIDLADVLQQLASSSKIIADARTNSVIVESSQPEELRRIEQIARELDERPSRAPSAPGTPENRAKPGPARRDPRERSNPEAMFPIDIPDHPEVLTLTAELRQLESQSVVLAEKIRAGLKDPLAAPTHTDPLRKELDEVLTHALTIKFKLEQVQLSALEERIVRLKRRTEKRTSSRQQIVERRARELIEGDTSEWNSGETDIAAIRPRPSKQGNFPEPKGAGSNESPVAQPFATYPDLASQLSMMEGNVVRAEERVTQLKRELEELNHRTQSEKDVEGVKRSLKEATKRLNSYQLTRTQILNTYQATMKDLELQLEAAQSQLELAREKAHRIEKLAKTGVISSAELIESQNEFNQARIAWERLKVQLKLYKKVGEPELTIEPAKEPGPVNQPVKKDESAERNRSLPQSDEGAGRRGPDQGLGMAGRKLEPTPDRPTPAPRPVTFGDCLQIIRNSNSMNELKRAIHRAAELQANGELSASDEQSMAEAILSGIHRMNQIAGGRGTPNLFLESWKQFPISIRTSVLASALKKTESPEQLSALGVISPLLDYVSEPEFPQLCDALLNLSASSDSELRIRALRILAETLALTKLDEAAFQSEGGKDLVRRTKAAVPRDRIFAGLKMGLEDKSIRYALADASLVTESAAKIDDDQLLKNTFELLVQIVQGQNEGARTSPAQRRIAMNGLTRLQSRPAEVVPILIKLLNSSDYEFGPMNSEKITRQSVIESLRSFGPAARDAIPALEDELILLKVEADKQKSGDIQIQQEIRAMQARLRDVIERIKASEKIEGDFSKAPTVVKPE